MSKLKINLFGESFKIKRLAISTPQNVLWQSIAIKMKQPLCKVLVDPFFYYLLSDELIQKYEDIEGEVQHGLMNTSKNNVEIWFQKKKIQKLKINDLNEELLLFPLYSSVKTEFTFCDVNGYYIEERAIGLVGSYEIYIDNFKIEDLEFRLFEVNGMTILQELNYQKKPLMCKKIESLIIYQNGYIVD